MDKKFDELLTELGTGRWNLLIFLSAGYWMSLMPFHAFAGTFLAPQVNHTCILPPEALTDYDSVTEMYPNRTRDDVCWYQIRNDGGQLVEKQCTKWEFDNSTYTSTVTAEFDLVCENKYVRTTFQSIYYFAGILGSPLNGFLADKYGRKRLVFLASYVFVLLGLTLSWIHNFTAIMVVRSIMGLVNPAAIHSNFNLCLEVSEPKYRAVVGILVFLPWAFSMICWGVLGYLIRSWRWLQFTSILPMVLYLPMIWFADESPRWLIVRGHHDRALEVLQRAARWNKSTLPPENQLRNLMKAIQYEGSTDNNNRKDHSRGMKQIMKRFWRSIIMLFRTPKIRALTMAMYCMYLVLGTVYFGLSVGGDNFGSDPFVYMMLSGVMEIPGGTITLLLVQRFGRRLPNAVCFFITGISLLIFPFVPASMSWLSTTLVMIGKLAISAAYQIAFLLASEVFPTEVRARGLGTSSTIAVAGIAASPYIVEILGGVGRWVPSVVFGIGGIVAGFVTFTVPEPLGAALPDTVAVFEAGAFSKKSHSSSEQTFQASFRRLLKKDSVPA